MMHVSPPLLISLALVGAVAGLLVWQGKIPFSYNVRNLVVRWKTTLLTILAFVAVNSLLVVMMAFVNGMYQLTDSSGNPANVVVLSEGATDETFSNLQFTDAGELENHSSVARDNGRPMCSRESYLVVNQPIPDARPGRPKRRFLQLRGMDDPGPVGRHSRFAAVRRRPAGFRRPACGNCPVRAPATRTSCPPSRSSWAKASLASWGGTATPAAMQAARNRERLDVGDVFVLGERQWLVVGVMQSSGSTFDSEVWAKRAIIGPMFGKETYTSLVLASARRGSGQRVEGLPEPGIQESRRPGTAGGRVFCQPFPDEQAVPGQRHFRRLLAGHRRRVCGLMNTMFAAVSQRKRDIGVLRLLGFARWQILVSLLIESLLLGLLGGLLGCGLGSLCNGVKASSIVSSGQGGVGKFVVLVMTVDGDTVLLGILLSAAMGLLGGLLPAIVAVCRRPLEALR